MYIPIIVFDKIVDPTSITNDIIEPSGKVLVEFTLGTGRGNQSLDAAFTTTSPGMCDTSLS